MRRPAAGRKRCAACAAKSRPRTASSSRPRSTTSRFPACSRTPRLALARSARRGPRRQARRRRRSHRRPLGHPPGPERRPPSPRRHRRTGTASPAAVRRRRRGPFRRGRPAQRLCDAPAARRSAGGPCRMDRHGRDAEALSQIPQARRRPLMALPYHASVWIHATWLKWWSRAERLDFGAERLSTTLPGRSARSPLRSPAPLHERTPHQSYRQSGAGLDLAPLAGRPAECHAPCC